VPSSKMKCNSVEYVLQRQIQKGVANEPEFNVNYELKR